MICETFMSFYFYCSFHGVWMSAETEREHLTSKSHLYESWPLFKWTRGLLFKMT